MHCANRLAVAISSDIMIISLEYTICGLAKQTAVQRGRCDRTRLEEQHQRRKHGSVRGGNASGSR